MIRVQLYAASPNKGFNDTDRRLTKVDKLLTKQFGGFTVVPMAYGVYANGDKAENTLIYTCFDEIGVITPEEVRELAQKIAVILNQESVLFTYETVNGGFAYSREAANDFIAAA